MDQSLPGSVREDLDRMSRRRRAVLSDVKRCSPSRVAGSLGSRTRTIRPCGARSRSSISPPVALDDISRDGEAEAEAAARDEHARASPLKNGSNTFSRSSGGMPGPSSPTSISTPRVLLKAKRHRDDGAVLGRIVHDVGDRARQHVRPASTGQVRWPVDRLRCDRRRRTPAQIVWSRLGSPRCATKLSERTSRRR